MSVYVSPNAAHSQLGLHTMGTPAGRCVQCGEMEPCSTRTAAHLVLWLAGRQLPRRIPGNSGPHWAGSRPAMLAASGV